MGATAAVEIQKPVDASDIFITKDIMFAQNEVIRLRKALGHLANSYGVNCLTMDSSDLVLGKNEDDDFQRCVDYIAHIRKCLQLNTLSSERQSRRRMQHWQVPRKIESKQEALLNEGKEEVEDSDSSSEEEDDRSTTGV